MSPAAAMVYLRGRLRVQGEEKTAYNRLRWTKTDLAAVQALVDLVSEAAARSRQKHDVRGGHG